MEAECLYISVAHDALSDELGRSHRADKRNHSLIQPIRQRDIWEMRKVETLILD